MRDFLWCLRNLWWCQKWTPCRHERVGVGKWYFWYCYDCGGCFGDWVPPNGVIPEHPVYELYYEMSPEEFAAQHAAQERYQASAELKQ